MRGPALDTQKVEPTGFADRLEMVCERKRGVKADAQRFGLSTWNTGAALADTCKYPGGSAEEAVGSRVQRRDANLRAIK